MNLWPCAFLRPVSRGYRSLAIASAHLGGFLFSHQNFARLACDRRVVACSDASLFGLIWLLFQHTRTPLEFSFCVSAQKLLLAC
jgi:hypothetical protein